MQGRANNIGTSSDKACDTDCANKSFATVSELVASYNM